jgi:hypothetical protein
MGSWDRGGFDRHWNTAALVDVGGSHIAHRFNCQDHAVVASCAQGVVLCVADGVSVVGGELSKAEAGAWAGAELATRGALEALQRGVEPSGVRLEVANYLARGLGPITQLLGVKAQVGLSSTLLIMVVTPRWTCAWGSGDGFWGVTLPAEIEPSKAHPANRQLRHEGRCPVGPHAAFAEWYGSRHSTILSQLATTSAGEGVDAVLAQLEPLLVVEDGPVIAAYVATDGLRHEPAAGQLLGQPGADWRPALTRPANADDLGVAWAGRKGFEQFAACNPFASASGEAA